MQIVGAIFLIILFLIFIFEMLPLIIKQAGVSYGIQLENNRIVQGSNTKLFYKVINNLDENVTNVFIEYEITNTTIGGNTRNALINIVPKQDYLNNVDLRTEYLNKGVYVVKATLYYTYKGQITGIPLTLSLEIY